VVLLLWRGRACCEDGDGGYEEVCCTGRSWEGGEDDGASKGGVGGHGVGGDGEGVEEAEGVSGVEGEGEEVGALQSVADGRWEELMMAARAGPGRVDRRMVFGCRCLLVDYLETLGLEIRLLLAEEPKTAYRNLLRHTSSFLCMPCLHLLVVLILKLCMYEKHLALPLHSSRNV
jgi:hypothetical protein